MSRSPLLFAVLLSGVSAGQIVGQAPPGKVVYDRWCAGCHGDKGAGDGDGATAMLPRPRDFTRGVYKIRTTASGEIPTDDDMLHVIAEGMPGTAMPAWKAKLSEQERRDVVAYLKSFSSFFAGTQAKPIQISQEPGGGDAAIADGKASFQKLECAKCHGASGRGDGKSAPTLKDDWGHPIHAADLTESWKFRGGSDVQSIYVRLRTGLDGTPMPSFADAIDQKLITEEQLWHVAAYVHSLSPAAPAVREVVRARLVAALPRTPDDRAWSATERYWIPVVGQVVVKPRWFAPTVDGVWLQAMHDGRQLALRLVWNDPSSSPAPAWNEWLARLDTTLTTADGPNPAQQGPDRLSVQWPLHPGDDTERPYFLGGSTRRPVQLWRWTSSPDQVQVGAATGLGTFTPSSTAGGDSVAHAARFDNGQWRLQLVRTLQPRDTSRGPVFHPGRAVPVALFVADGSNGEDDVRNAVSTWYAIHLDVPTPARVYAAPAITVLLTAGLGMLLVTRAQRRDHGEEQDSDHTQSEGSSS
jgi:DMSO reductase family type II enzyme heme b subunit